jgi:uncharacterized protein YcfJ
MAPFNKSPMLLAVAAATALPLAGCADRYGSVPGYRTVDNDGYYINDDDQIYRGTDGNYYCKKPDGTTGLIVGGLAGGVLGNVIAPGGSKTLGTILGAGIGAVAGREIDRSRIRCK